MRVRQWLLAAILALVPSLASAETVDVSDDLGGLCLLYQCRWEKLAAKKRERADFGPLHVGMHHPDGLHSAQGYLRHRKGQLRLPSRHHAVRDRQLWKAYPDDIRAWITKNGGLKFIEIMWLQAPEIFHYFHKCTS